MWHPGRRPAGLGAMPAVPPGLAAVAVLVVGASTLGASPARAAALTRCTTTEGTVVAVDFGHWGGPVVRGCGVQPDGSPDASGYALLHDGGFTTAGDEHDGPALICRLGNASYDGGAQHPTPAQAPCTGTPPASAYWSYWLAGPGATTWQFSSAGAAGDHPVAGGVELWDFGGTDGAGTTGSGVPPAGLIDQLRAQGTSPAPAPTSRPPTTPTTPAATRTASGAPPGPAAPPSTGASASAGGSTRPGGPPAATPPAPSAARSTSQSTARTGSGGTAPPSRRPPASRSPADAGTGGTASSPQVVAATAASASDRTPATGSALPVVITLALVAVLGAGGWLSLRCRRAGDRETR